MCQPHKIITLPSLKRLKDNKNLKPTLASAFSWYSIIFIYLFVCLFIDCVHMAFMGVASEHVCVFVGHVCLCGGHALSFCALSPWDIVSLSPKRILCPKSAGSSALAKSCLHHLHCHHFRYPRPCLFFFFNVGAVLRIWTRAPMLAKQALLTTEPSPQLLICLSFLLLPPWFLLSISRMSLSTFHSGACRKQLDTGLLLMSIDDPLRS